MPAKTLGEFIRSRRDELDISLRELARQLDITPPFLSDIELGKRYPSEPVMLKLANHFRISIDDLKLFDHRESLSELKRLLEQNANLNIAFRTAIEDVKEGNLSPEQLAKRINPTTGKK
ncbi:MAG: helix-turn-helix domain-containing protein [Verrucomicrobiales bacterium]|jgi:transcriptional regulator with XRE-family HTH domain|nr:helix-turn-helix domain-containing protein [Verrucomicrobiales bacterium]